MGALDPETEELEAVPQNRHVLAVLRRSAAPARTPYRLGAFEQQVHPDVCERLEALARGGRPVGAYGLCARVGRRGTLYAIAMGTGSIALRLPEGPAREALVASGGRSDADLGPEWVIADAWLSKLPGTEGSALLAGWIEAARFTADA